MLSVVREVPPARTLIEMAGGDPEQVDAMMQREFGRRAVLVSAMNLYVFEDDIFTDETIGTHIADTGLVSGVFRGIETVEAMELTRPHSRLSVVTETQRQLAVFATHMDWQISARKSSRMQANDTSVASSYPRVAVALDEPVGFHGLKSEARLRRAEQEEPRLEFKLHLVGENA